MKIKKDLFIWQISEGVSMKLWRLLWLLRGFKLTLNWKRYRIPIGLWILKIFLVSGRKKVKMGPEGIKRWKVIEMFNKYVPGSNIVRKESIPVSWWFTSHLSNVTNICTIQQGLRFGEVFLWGKMVTCYSTFCESVKYA